MLIRLSISNFALIKDADIYLKSGFTAITGETGAGKSLLVGAISFLAGGKAKPNVIRDGASMAVVEAEFVSEKNESTLIRRELRRDGKSRSFVNDSPVSLKSITPLTSSLIDITGQRAFSHLLDPVKQLEFLDIFAGTIEKTFRLKKFESDYNILARKISAMIRKQDDFRRGRELLRFQQEEIEAVDPQPSEDESISDEIKRLENFEEFQTTAKRFMELVSTGDNPVESLLAEAESLLEQLGGFDRELSSFQPDLISLRSALKEITSTVSLKSDGVFYEAERLEQLRERQFQLAGLSKKFGGSLTAMFERYKKILDELAEGEEFSEEIEQTESKRERLLNQWIAVAEVVSRKRTAAAVKLEKIVERSLRKLGIPKCRFEVRLTASPDQDGVYIKNGDRFRLTGDGLETVQMFFSANPGIEPRPLSQVASGGELSRLMLALKEALPLTSREATIIFDEIDTGVSGRVAELVGLKLRELSRNRQLVSITHLPQIASVADNHLRVSKDAKEGVTETEIKEMTGEDRIREIGLLLSGDEITEAAIEQARNLLLSKASTK